MTEANGFAWLRFPIWGVTSVALIGLAACTSGGGGSHRQTPVIDPQNVASLVPAAVLSRGGVIAWSGDEKTFAVARAPLDPSPEISLFVYEQGTLANPRTIPAAVGTLALAFSPDGKTLAAGGEDGLVRLRDVGSGEIERSLTGHNGPVLGIAFHPGGEILASRDESSVRLWDPATGTLLRQEALQTQPPFGGMSFSSDGRWLGVVHYSAEFPNGRVDLLSVDGSDSPTVSFADEGLFLLTLAFDPSGRLLAMLGEDRRYQERLLRLWRFEDDPPDVGLAGEVLRDADSLSFSPDGRILVAGHGLFDTHPSEGVQFWDVRTGKLLHTMGDWFEAPFEPVTFSPDGRWLARSSSTVGLVSIYEVGQDLSSTPRTLSLQSPQLVGNDVFRLEGDLKDLGYFRGETVDGVFDGETDAALRSFQAAKLLPVDGIADSATLAQINQSFARAEASATETTVPAPPVANYPSATPAPPPVRTLLPTDQEVENVASIWDWYNLSEGLDLQSPGSREFSITMTPAETFIWPFYWCAADEDLLAENLQSISVAFQVDLADVSPGDILEFERDIPDWKCHYWATTLTDWQPGSQASLSVIYEFSQDVNDGRNVYPAGEYAYVVQVIVGD